MKLLSPAFPNGGPIPVDHTGDGLDVSPPLIWTDVPPDAQSLVLIVDDPDAAAYAKPLGAWLRAPAQGARQRARGHGPGSQGTPKPTGV